MRRVTSVRARLRAVCLDLPETFEKETWGDPTYRVRARIFAMEKRGDGRISVWFKAPPGSQDILIGSDAALFLHRPMWVRGAGSACASTTIRIGRR